MSCMHSCAPMQQLDRSFTCSGPYLPQKKNKRIKDKIGFEGGRTGSSELNWNGIETDPPFTFRC